MAGADFIFIWMTEVWRATEPKNLEAFKKKIANYDEQQFNNTSFCCCDGDGCEMEWEEVKTKLKELKVLVAGYEKDFMKNCSDLNECYFWNEFLNEVRKIYGKEVVPLEGGRKKKRSRKSRRGKKRSRRTRRGKKRSRKSRRGKKRSRRRRRTKRRR